jgi:hypothetical protein
MSTKSKYFKEGDLITNLENLAASQGYISAKKLHSQNIINEKDDDDDVDDDEEEDDKKEKENISDFLSNGNYYVPSYLTFLNDENKNENDHENDKIENITITITPVEKCNPIDDELYNKLVESAELQKNTNNTKNKLKNKSIKNKKTKKVLNKNNNNKKIKGGKKTKRKN